MFKYLKSLNRFPNIIKRLYTKSTIIKHKFDKTIKYKVNENSLERRFLNYLKKPSENTNIIINTTNVDLNKLNNQQILYLITKQFFNKKFIKTLDLECRKRLQAMETDEIFTFLCSFTESYPAVITKLPFYEQSLNKLSYFIHNLSKDEIVQLCFYTGLNKKSNVSQQIMKNCLNRFSIKEFLDTLTTEDLVIICNAAFKTSTKIHQKLLLTEVQNRIYNELNILNDEAIFITLVKSLRHNQNYDEELLTTISTTMFFNKTIYNYNFTALVHILALYADGLYYKEELLKVVNKRSLEFLKNAKPVSSTTEYFSNTVRIKDLGRYLWSLSYLGYDLSVNNIELYVIPIIKQYLKVGSIEKVYEDLFSCCLAFAFFGYYPLDILKKILTDKISGMRSKSFAARLNILLTCLQLEKPQFFNTLKIDVDPPPDYNIMSQVHRRPYLAVLYDSVNNLKNNLYLTKVEFSCQIPHLSIVGISCYNEKNCKLHIECVDDDTCVKNTEYSPNGSMKLKLRLLRSLKKPILRINQNEIIDMSEEELNKYLRKKIKRLL